MIAKRPILERSATCNRTWRVFDYADNEPDVMTFSGPQAEPLARAYWKSLMEEFIKKQEAAMQRDTAIVQAVTEAMHSGKPGMQALTEELAKIGYKIVKKEIAQ